MTDRSRRDPEVLSDALSTRVLTRASELDAALKAGARISELRAAAVEAGISTSAFDQALAEVQAAESAPVPSAQAASHRSTRVSAAIATVLAMVIGVSVLILPRLVVSARPATVQQSFALRCLSPRQAADLIRPLTDPRTTSISFAPEPQRLMEIRATPAEMQKIQAALAEVEAAPSCVAAPAKAP